MNQEKIGKFIAECRKGRNLTQQKLAEQLGVTNRSISNWENGKNMPDVSLYKELCGILGISINELLSGERLNQEDYQDKSEENMVKFIDEVKKLKKKKKVLFSLLTSILILVVLYVVYCNILLIEKPLEYDSRVMKCRFENDMFIYNFQTSIVHITYSTIELDDEKIILINAKLAIKDKKRYHFENYQNMANLSDGKEKIFGAGGYFNIDPNDNIKVYYTEQSLDSIDKEDKESIKQVIKESDLMCKNY